MNKFLFVCENELTFFSRKFSLENSAFLYKNDVRESPLSGKSEKSLFVVRREKMKINKFNMAMTEKLELKYFLLY